METENDVARPPFPSLPTSAMEYEVSESAYLYVSDHSNPTLLTNALQPSWRGRAEVGRALVLPCRPSHPGHQVRLKTNDGIDVTRKYAFTPKRGFVLSERVADSAESARLAGRYECVFSSPYVFELSRFLAVEEDRRKFMHDNDTEGEGGQGETGGGDSVRHLNLIVALMSTLVCVGLM